MNPSEVDFVGYRLCVAPPCTVAHGLLLGTVEDGERPSFDTMKPACDSTRSRVALVSPSDGGVVAQFRVERTCRGACALGTDRLLLIEGSALVERAIDGSQRRVLVKDAVGILEQVIDDPITDGTIAIVLSASSRRADNEQNEPEMTDVVRCFDLRERALRWQQPAPADVMFALLGETFVTVVSREWRFGDDDEFVTFDAATGRQRCNGWIRGADWLASDSSIDSIALLSCDTAPSWGNRTPIDPRDGSALPAQPAVPPWMVRARSMGARRVLRSNTADTVSVYDVESVEPIARFFLGSRPTEAVQLSDDRWLVRCEHGVFALQIEPPSVLASHRVDLGGSLSSHGGDVDVGARRIVVRTDEWAGGEPLPHGLSARPVSLNESEPLVVARTNHRSPTVHVPRSIDEHRLSAIVATARDEDWIAQPAWQRLFAQGLVEEALFPFEEAVTWTTDGLAAKRLERGARRTFVTLAYHSSLRCDAEALVREFAQRLCPWGLVREPSLHWEVMRWMQSAIDEPALESAVSAINGTLRFAEEPFVQQDAASLHDRWIEASKRGLCLPDALPECLAGRPVREVPSPFAPLVALLDLGVHVQSRAREPRWTLGLPPIEDNAGWSKE